MFLATWPPPSSKPAKETVHHIDPLTSRLRFIWGGHMIGKPARIISLSEGQ